ncbi:HXXEE domain-containing protein [Halosolutus gelatinilyticus]|uniref:HXXEE domain-containing protein n=1 Tax=Halosolutus gelatinilyticus TaxID=2931975 RepID=UPI001FF4A218|nr:HXXEE domain-containing protein [Halosolutus gelatinilyticus]
MDVRERRAGKRITGSVTFGTRGRLGEDFVSSVEYDYLLWVMVTAYALHIVEEYQYNWRAWATSTLHLDVDWRDFYLTNGCVIVLGISAAMIGWRAPWLSLTFPALALINAVFFHILPTIRTRVFSPGLVTAVLLFLPISGWVYYGAYRDGVATVSSVSLSVVGGALLMAYPIVLLLTKGRFDS